MTGTGGQAGLRTLVAGVGNVFLGDDGFGVEVARRLREVPLPGHVEVVDVGVRGVHLAYQLLDGYDTLVLVDATCRGSAPGTLHLLDVDDAEEGRPVAAVLDGHRMTPDAVLALLATLCSGTGAARPRRVWVVGCEPATVEEGIGLSAPVAAAVEGAVRMVVEVVTETSPAPSGPAHTEREEHTPC
ncbi:hydrogenase maturation protease [Streptomyces sp. NPDC059740]|uniref:hydrogenase maturation protease n=1 Tax=Streptomyces sp. NPDC059740 TaxID=3346926 RepID=UPI003649F1D1